MAVDEAKVPLYLAVVPWAWLMPTKKESVPAQSAEKEEPGPGETAVPLSRSGDEGHNVNKTLVAVGAVEISGMVLLLLRR